MTPDKAAREVDSKQPWHAFETSAVATMLGSGTVRGLTPAEAHGRLKTYGPNVLLTRRTTPWYTVLARQFKEVLIVILLIAALIAYLVGEVGDTATILAIVLLNGALGFAQEWKAERAMAALQNMLAPRCTAVREGREQEIEARDLVPGDLVQLDIGDRVPADLRLVDVTNLQVDESALTGESVSVRKDIVGVGLQAPLAERDSMAWMGTSITNGRARGLVVATGMRTEFGHVAELTSSVGVQRTPLQGKLAALGRQLGVASVVVSVAVAIAGWLLGKAPLEMFMTGVSLAVAVVPEGLPAVVTITLALGVRSMVRRRALLRRLQAAETLGAATVICTDKTGTLTQNEMTVTDIWLPSGQIKVTGVGYAPHGDIKMMGEPIDARRTQQARGLLRSALICNHARILMDGDTWKAFGEPTEAALITAAFKAGLYLDDMPAAIAEFSFSSTRKRMTVVSKSDDEVVAHVKGAPEYVLDLSSRTFDGNDERSIDDVTRNAMKSAYTRLAKSGLRTLAVATRRLDPGLSLEPDIVERDLTLLGFVGIIDPPRAEVPAAIQIARQAGIRVLMITGDAPDTALAVARQTGLAGAHALTGTELDSFDEAELEAVLDGQVVFARATPEHKLRIVSLLQQQGHVVGMTGDGVNDAPALQKADIGIAMGQRGTDVARNASDMILTDDNFASIIGAVEEGRRQYANIQKFVRYLLSSNTGEVVAIFLNILMGGPLILLPVQILWMNLVTDGMTAVALGMEPAERGLMQRPPRAAGESILNRSGILMVVALGAYIGVATLILFHFYLGADNPAKVAMAHTVAFTAIIVMEKVNVFNFRSLSQPMSRFGFFSNRWVLLAWFATVALQVAAVYTPVLQAALHTVPLGLKEWGLIIFIAAPVFLVTETGKWLWVTKQQVATKTSRPDDP